MNRATLQTLAHARGFSRADVARAAGVSRQAVSKWFRGEDDWVAVKSTHLRALATALAVRPGVLLEELPGLSTAERTDLEARLLWDRAYPHLDALLIALARGETRALGRLVEVLGLHRAARLVGDGVWSRFPDYARFVHPARRRGLEDLWRRRSRAQS